MKKKWLVILFCGVALFATLIYFTKSEQDGLERKAPRKGLSSFFVQVPIERFSPGKIPRLRVSIEDQVFLMDLDLGFGGYISILSKYTDGFSEKKIVNSSDFYGIRGKRYQANCYEIPKIKIGEMVFKKLILKEESLQEQKETIIAQSEDPPISSKVGCLGWKLFYRSNLFLDSSRSMVAFCDSIETLGKRGYPLKKFTKVPFSIERGIIEFVAQTDQGPLACFLDSGCTWNFINGEIKGNTPMEKWVLDPESFHEVSSFKIGDKDFGSLFFRSIPVKLPIPVETILGMEFLQDHVVFIDFRNRDIYFALSEELSLENSK